MPMWMRRTPALPNAPLGPEVVCEVVDAGEDLPHPLGVVLGEALRLGEGFGFSDDAVGHAQSPETRRYASSCPMPADSPRAWRSR